MLIIYLPLIIIFILLFVMIFIGHHSIDKEMNYSNDQSKSTSQSKN